MNRNTLLGLTATLNVIHAALDRAGHRAAANHVNAAVGAAHREARWSEDELRRMGEVQAWMVEELFLSPPPFRT